MSFKSNVRKYIDNTENDIKRECESPIYSFNKLSLEVCGDKIPNIIICGTLTPSNHRGQTAMNNRCCFYQSNGNKMYQFLGDALKLDLVTFKENLEDKNEGNQAAKEILNKLKDNDVMLLDVVKCCKDNTRSNSDDNIEYFCLDYDSLRRYLKPNVKWIFNSRNSEYAFKQMFKNEIKGNLIKNKNMIYVAQINYRKTTEQLKKEWKSALE